MCCNRECSKIAFFGYSPTNFRWLLSWKKGRRRYPAKFAIEVTQSVQILFEVAFLELISEKKSLPKICQNTILRSTVHRKRRYQGCDLSHFWGDLGQSEKLSEINPPLKETIILNWLVVWDLVVLSIFTWNHILLSLFPRKKMSWLYILGKALNINFDKWTFGPRK